MVEAGSSGGDSPPRKPTASRCGFGLDVIGGDCDGAEAWSRTTKEKEVEYSGNGSLRPPPRLLVCPPQPRSRL